MKAPTFLLGVVLLATSVSAQEAPIPQDLPLSLRQTSDAVRRRVEQVIPPNLPVQRPTMRLNNGSLLNRLRAGSIEDRIAALEAKVQALQKEVEAQKAMIEQLKELLNQQQKKN